MEIYNKKMKNILNQKIIDTHHHLWDPTSNKYDWLVAKDNEIFNKIYLLKDFIQDIKNLNIIKSVHVQADINISETIFETEWLQKISNFEPSLNKNAFPNAIIGFANFLDPDVKNFLSFSLTKFFTTNSS